MRKKCDKEIGGCGKMYEPKYPTEKLNKLSKICPECVEKHNKEVEKYQNEMVMQHNHYTRETFGYVYVSHYDLLPGSR